MSFPEYSYFLNPSFGISSSLNAFSGGPSSQLKNISSDGGSKMDPFSIAMAGIGGLGSAVGGIFGSQGAAQAAYQNALMAGAGLQYKQAEALGSLGQSRWNQLFPAGAGGDVSFGREKEAEKFKQFFTRPQDLLYASEASKRANLSRTSEAAKNAALFESELNRRNQIALDQNKLAGMFGETGFSRRFTG